jgi:hypothetical protein
MARRPRSLDFVFHKNGIQVFHRLGNGETKQETALGQRQPKSLDFVFHENGI